MTRGVESQSIHFLEIAMPQTAVELTGLKALSLPQLEKLLLPKAVTTMRELTHLFKLPHDTPSLNFVLINCCRAIASFAATVESPTPYLFNKSIELSAFSVQLIDLSSVATTVDVAKPLLRRLTNVPAYALFMDSSHTEGTHPWQIALGAQCLLCLLAGEKFRGSIAGSFRRLITPSAYGLRAPDPAIRTRCEKQFRKILEAAHLSFSTDAPPEPDDPSSRIVNFSRKAKNHIHGRAKYSPPSLKQSTFARNVQHSRRHRESGMQIYAAAMQGDETSQLTMVAAIAGLPPNLTMDMPVAPHCVPASSFMSLDLTWGCIVTDLAHIIPSPAKADSGAECFVPAAKILCTPLPEALARFLRNTQRDRPTASTVGELLPQASTSNRSLTLVAKCGIRASRARFLRGFGAHAVTCAIDRLHAALISKDFSLIPYAKLYYCLVSPAALWESCRVLYSKLEWGDPVDAPRDVAFGSEVVSTAAAMSELFSWMETDHRDGYSFDMNTMAGIIERHNKFALVTASIITISIGARESRVLNIEADQFSSHAQYALYSDKATTRTNARLPVPLNKEVRRQLENWDLHVQALIQILQQKPGRQSERLRKNIATLLLDQHRPLVFRIDDRLAIRAVGSSNLIKWWSKKFPFPANVGRHFWQAQLHADKVPSTLIDIFMRHQSHGNESYRANSKASWNSTMRTLATAQEAILSSMGWKAIPSTLH